jgi:hypothetical protein
MAGDGLNFEFVLDLREGNIGYIVKYIKAVPNP